MRAVVAGQSAQAFGHGVPGKSAALSYREGGERSTGWGHAGASTRLKR